MTVEEKKVIDDLLQTLYSEPDHHAGGRHTDCEVCQAMTKVEELLGFKYEWLLE